MILKKSEGLIDEAVTHNPRVRKKVWLRKEESENITQISRSVFPGGEACGTHVHHDMAEFFLVEQGEVIFTVEGLAFAMSAGDAILIHPGEVHEVTNKASSPATLTVMSWTKCF